MRKIIMFNLITLDGYFEGCNHDISWHTVDEEFNQSAMAQFDACDTLLFGRLTYQVMEAYWPTKVAMKEDPATATFMNECLKVVFSRTLKNVTWKNTVLKKGNLVEEITTLKGQPGKEIMIFGSGSLVAALAPEGLINEYRFMANPLVLGSGNSLFAGIKERLNLQLIDTRTFGSGNVLLRYKNKKENEND